MTVFPPEVLARISPELTLQRHLAHGLRPLLREFDEFKATLAQKGNLNGVGASVVGLSIVRTGLSYIFCGVTVGINEINDTDNEQELYLSVYPVVEIARGRIGAPLDEEMILSQKLYNHIYHLRLLQTLLLDIVPGYELPEETGSTIFYPDTTEDSDLAAANTTVNVSRRKLRYVLYAHLKVFSRDGPLFDSCQRALLEALQDVKLPRVYVADSGVDPNVRVPVRLRGNFGHLNLSLGNYCLDQNPEIAQPLRPNSENIGVSSSFGVAELADESSQLALLADLEGEAEENVCESKINVVATKDKLTHVSIAAGGANVTLDVIKEAIRLSHERAAKGG